MRVLYVASECVPFIKTGGLADVVGALPKALAQLGVDVQVMLPAYPELAVHVENRRRTVALGNVNGGPIRLVRMKVHELSLILVDAPHLYARSGHPYLAEDGTDWPDNHLRFGALSYAAAEVGRGALRDWQPDLLHLHDWQAGLVPAYLKLAGGRIPPTILTIHNVAFQGLFQPSAIEELGLPQVAFGPEKYEYYGKLSFLKAALVDADKITTVSPTYARELLTTDFGMGLDGVLATRERDLVGILNGIDTNVWNPATDPSIVSCYSSRSHKRKALNKTALEARFGLEASSAKPLFCIISRLTAQKGLDILLAALPRLVSRGARLAVLGSGDGSLEAAFLEASKRYAGKVGVVIGYNEPLSHLMQAGADAILVPSRFEPCGLTQLYGLRYGTIPVVARTGGLADTVIDANQASFSAGCATGFQFSPVETEALATAIDRACDAYSDPTLWQPMVRRAMRHSVGWEDSARSYLELYQALLNRETG